MLYPDTDDVLAFQLRSTECCVGTVPEPERATIAGEFVALLTNDTVPDAAPLRFRRKRDSGILGFAGSQCDGQANAAKAETSSGKIRCCYGQRAGSRIR